MGFIVGVVYVCQSPLQAPMVGLALCLSLTVILWRKPAIRKLFGGVVLGMLCASIQLSTAHVIPERLHQGQSDFELLVEIISLERQKGDTSRFVANIREVDGKAFHFSKPKVMLRWAKQTPPSPGEQWRLRAKLKPLVGLSNPGLRDASQTLRARGILLLGDVKTHLKPQRVNEAHPKLIKSMRERLIKTLDAQTSNGFVFALAVGDQSKILPEQWEILRKTSTAHLMAISGLHLGLVFGLVYALMLPMTHVVLKRWHTASRKLLAAMGAVMGSFAYLILTGAALSTQRAWVMALIAVFFMGLQRKINVITTVLIAVTLIVLFDPWASLSTGLWLSAGAVITIAWLVQYPLGRAGYLKSFCLGHLQIAFALMPMTVMFFHQIPWLSPFANLIAIPWVTLLIVPPLLVFDLLAVCLPSVAALILKWVEWNLALLSVFLQKMSESGGVSDVHFLSRFQALALIFICVLLCLPKKFPGRILLPCFCVVLLFPQTPRPQQGEAWIDVIDVGQGLGVWVRTEAHELLFDAGHPVVGEYLTRWKSQGLDKTIISHADWDHRAGLSAVQSHVSMHELLVGAVLPHQNPQEPCIAGARWEWEGVTFELLHPSDPTVWSGNNGSCVLRVETSGGSVLFTGDIEKKAERYLSETNPSSLRSDILIAPHHGSKTSSSQTFLDAVAPGRVIVSSGYLNRYHHPHSDVTARYAKMGIKTYNTAQHGALRVTLSKDGITVRCTKNGQPGWRILKGETC